MRIAVDIEPYYVNRSGVGRYVHGVLSGLTRLEHDDRYTLFRSRTYAREEAMPNLARERVSETVLPRRHRTLQLTWLLVGRPPVETFVGDHDVYFGTCVPAFPTRGRLVVTVHDLVWMRFPGMFSRRADWGRRRGLRYVLRHAATVIADSEATRRDIIEFTGFDARRVRTVLPGIDESFLRRPGETGVDETLARLKVRRPYVLAVAGDNSPKKNLPTLVRALSRLPADMSDVTLVNVGKPRYDVRALTEEIDRLRMSDRVTFLGRVSDDDLRSLYVGARVTAFPSFCEGFGFPIVESMAQGTPVVTSNVSSMPEVAGDAAVLVDPRDVDGLSAAVRSLVSDDALHARLRAKGLERIRAFSWEKSARQTRALFAELTGE